ncbi:hypothetical protein ACFVIM_04305 [Streptomyces sp. NPDC057638]|uniref:hypothetical protein n=1 Tax=Streptomyces sp. NPDC057638 TaxID=3346190 RepID=UPI0036AAF696
MAWLCAEYVADEMLRGGALVEGGTLEFRAGRETLALTVHLCDTETPTSQPSQPSPAAGFVPAPEAKALSRVEEWLSLTSYGHPWYEWVETCLAERERAERALGCPDPDLALAKKAWRWLRDTELFAADLGATEVWHTAEALDALVDEDERIWTPAWQLGLPLSHLAIHLF